MLAALLLNPVMAFPTGGPPSKTRPAIKVKYIWPPLDYEADVEKEITRQEKVSRKKPTRAKKEPSRIAAMAAVERHLAIDIAKENNIPAVEAWKLLRRHKTEYLVQMARQAIEDDDEEALFMVLLLME